jgi:Uncharacterized protein conserved in bacteria (DUF2332)
VSGDPREIAERYRRFAEVECKGYSEAYYKLALGVAEDPEVLSFLSFLPVWQPNLFFAAVQFLTGPHDMPGPGRDLRVCLARRGGEIADLMRARRTQTNEVARCAALLPALPAGPLALVEVGASAGLCLPLDRFSYDWGAAQLGVPTATVRLYCPVTGPAPLPSATIWRRWTCTTTRRPAGCSPACGRISPSGVGGWSARSSSRERRRPRSGRATWSMTFPPS